MERVKLVQPFLMIPEYISRYKKRELGQCYGNTKWPEILCPPQ